MNEDVLKIIQGAEHLYPHELEKRFSRILNKIVELWDTPQMEAYFLELLVDSRGNRHGFPPEVAEEIYSLSRVYDHLHPERESTDPWATLDIAKQGEIEHRGYKRTPRGFMKAVENNDLWVVSMFLGRGIDIDTRDERGWTPLTISAFNGNEEIAQILVRSGADVQAKDNAGYGPIHWAAFNGYASVVKLLIVKGADVNARSQHGWTPLLQAATRGYVATCGALIAAGADVNLASDDGWTPLHKACANGHTGVVRLLLSARANRNAQYQNGITPLFLAEKNKHDEIIALLKEDAGTSDTSIRLPAISDCDTSENSETQ